LELTFHKIKSDKVAVDELYIIKIFLSYDLKISPKGYLPKGISIRRLNFGLNTNPLNWVTQINRISILQIFESFIQWVRNQSDL